MISKEAFIPVPKETQPARRYAFEKPTSDPKTVPKNHSPDLAALEAQRQKDLNTIRAELHLLKVLPIPGLSGAANLVEKAAQETIASEEAAKPSIKKIVKGTIESSAADEVLKLLR